MINSTANTTNIREQTVCSLQHLDESHLVVWRNWREIVIFLSADYHTKCKTFTGTVLFSTYERYKVGEFYYQLYPENVEYYNDKLTMRNI